jgi:S-DNA-T family DNA segregation ATPase FtsK/SpoIIIE
MAEVRAYEPPGDDEQEPRPDDAESYEQEPDVTVRVVEHPDKPTVEVTVTQLATSERRPILPGWLQSRTAFRAFSGQSLGLFWHSVRLHAWLLLTSYWWKVAVYAPWGVLRLAGRQLRWMWHPELTQLVQTAATRNDLDQGPRIARQVSEARKARTWMLLGELLGVLVAVPLLVLLAPAWAVWLMAAAAAAVFARIGRPAGKPIIQHVTLGKKMIRLTQEMVRDALIALRLAGLKAHGDVKFPPPGVHRDGPGWLARFELPAGLIASDVMDKRERLAGALRLPTDQVWLEVGPEHSAQVDLWVGYLPASKTGAPKWDLARPDARTSIFEPNPFAHDARGRAIDIILFERNVLLGGQPGSGKSFGARTLATIAGLDPTCEMKIAEFKGVGDFLDMEDLCTDYACGVDEEAFDIGEALVNWLLAECERRGARIKKLRMAGELPNGAITPEIGARKGSGLHPLFVLLDEFHELLLARPEVAGKIERILRRARALGIMLVLATQIPDSNTIPTGITKQVSVRICFSVSDWQSNDQILGTGSYKRGHSAIMFRPGYDSGWAVTQGLERPGQTIRTQFPDPETRALIVERMRQLRGGTAVGQREQRVQARNMLADVRQVLRDGEAGLPWDVIAERLMELAPEMYEGITGEMVRESLKRYDVPSQDVKVRADGEWTNVKGMRRKPRSRQPRPSGLWTTEHVAAGGPWNPAVEAPFPALGDLPRHATSGLFVQVKACRGRCREVATRLGAAT